MNQIKSIGKFVVMGLLGIITLTGGPAWSAKDASISSTSLTQSEKDGLIQMREEEKLARDVYLKMEERWGAKIFSNIVLSEQRHMDTVLKMLIKYGVDDPALPEVGEFTPSSGLQDMYDDLVAKGSKSLQDALIVGATIEDLDIKDLDVIIKEATDVEVPHYDLISAYTNLREGSYNHLQAYVGSLEILGYTYEPQYISEEEFDTIMGL